VQWSPDENSLAIIFYTYLNITARLTKLAMREAKLGRATKIKMKKSLIFLLGNYIIFFNICDILKLILIIK